MIRPKLITAPTVSPLSLIEIKDQLRITADDEDDKLESFAEAARIYFERETGRTLHETTWQIRLHSWPGIVRLPRAAPLWLDPAIVTPTPSISVFYRDSTGTETAWTSFVFDEDEEPAVIQTAYGESFPSFTPYPLKPIRIRYKAGIADDTSPQQHVSEEIKTCLLLMIGEMYEHREGLIIADRSDAAAVFAKNPRLPEMISGLRVSYGC